MFCYFAFTLTRSNFRLREKGFIFLALNPGWVNTDLAGEGAGDYVSFDF
jgi:hypothetical protein